MALCLLGIAGDVSTEQTRKIDVAIVSQEGAPAEMQRRGIAVRRTVVRGPRGGVAVGRSVVVGRPLPGGGVVRRGVWVRPAAYWWRPGGAIAAGAAIGVITAAAATAYVATRPPAPNHCWYYTNPQRTQGFWDVCQ